MRRATPMAGVAAAVAIPLTLFLAAPAGASHASAVKSKNESIGYTHVLTVKSRPLHRCVTIVLGGFIQYKFSASANSSIWTGQKLVKPIMVAGVHKLSHGRCRGSAKLTGFQLGQFWAGAKCGFNPVMTPVKPWKRFTGTWPNCGSESRRQVGYNAPKQNRSKSLYTIIFKGVEAKFAPFSEPGRPAHPPCYAISVAGTIYSGNSSDSFGGEPSDLTRHVCLKKT